MRSPENRPPPATGETRWHHRASRGTAEEGHGPSGRDLDTPMGTPGDEVLLVIGADPKTEFRVVRNGQNRTGRDLNNLEKQQTNDG